MQVRLDQFLRQEPKVQSDLIGHATVNIEIPKIDLSKIDMLPKDVDSLIILNEMALQLIEQGTFEEAVINKLFNGLGVEYVNTEGISGIYKKRMATLQQYFTPIQISELLVKILCIPTHATVLDNTCGSGRMFFSIPNKRLITGIELEERACKVAKALYPQACIIQDDAKYHIFNSNFDYVLLNPPFNIQWYIEKGLVNVGYRGAVLSHLACLEIGVKAVKPQGYLIAILPANVFKLDSTIKFHGWLDTQVQLVMRIELPSNIFLRANYPSTIFIFKKTQARLDYEELAYTLSSLEQLNELLEKVESWSGLSDLRKYAESRVSIDPVQVTPYKPTKLKRKNKVLPLVPTDEVVVGHHGNVLNLKPNGLVAQLKIQNIFARYNERKWDRTLKDYVNEVSKVKSLNEIWSTGKTLEDHPLIHQLRTLNLELNIKSETLRYIEKKRHWFTRQVTPMEQWVKESEQEEWKELYKEEGIRTSQSSNYEAMKQKVLNLKERYPFINTLYDFQLDDVIRASLKDSVIDCSQMGLGKTRKAITLALLRNVKHTLIILPTRLIHIWEREIKKLNNLVAKENRIQYKIIEKESDCRYLSKINIISYYTFSVKDWYNKPNKTFADKLKRRFKMVIADEAHAFSKKLSRRTRAIRKFKAKYWLFLTGTPIGNTVKNFWSLCDILFKAETPRFPYTTSDFRKEFVTVEMVTRQFDETLCQGKTSQQLPKIKDLAKFLSLVKYMWIRRLKEEPEVVKSVQIVKPKIEVKEFVADPDHWRVYKKYLDDFAELFRKYLHPNLIEHDRVKASVVLAQMGNLQFVSTIPQHAKFEVFTEEYRYPKKLTVIQEEVLRILRESYQHEKILVISQRPDFCSFIQQQLTRERIRCGVFTGQVPIEKRNILLDQFEESDSMNILLCSINVINEGVNLPKGTVVIIVDLDWTYQKLEQAYSRVLRPETKESPLVLMLYYKGFIDQYLWQHIRAKKSAVLSGVDHRKDTEDVNWVHWKQFTYDMLKDLGYDLD